MNPGFFKECSCNWLRGCLLVRNSLKLLDLGFVLVFVCFYVFVSVLVTDGHKLVTNSIDLLLFIPIRLKTYMRDEYNLYFSLAESYASIILKGAVLSWRALPQVIVGYFIIDRLPELPTGHRNCVLKPGTVNRLNSNPTMLAFLIA